MKTSFDSLKAGYAEWAEKYHGTGEVAGAHILADLSFLAGWLIEGDRLQKAEARKVLKKLIGRGRCILNAAALAEKTKKGNEE
jgi:hypothetical protein